MMRRKEAAARAKDHPRTLLVEAPEIPNTNTLINRKPATSKYTLLYLHTNKLL